MNRLQTSVPFFKLFLAFILGTTASLCAERAYPPQITSDRVEVYKSVDGVDLRLWFFMPEGHSEELRSPAIVFFFGGGWVRGSPEQFVRQSEYLAKRGMVAIVADYRVKSRNGVQAVKCVEDAKSAVRWIRKNADNLGIDPDRIVASGGSAGGHIAASTALLPYHDDPEDDLSISCQPNALVLFNPVLVVWNVEGYDFGKEENFLKMPERLGVDPKTLSPFHNLRAGVPPAIIFHGTADQAVPYPSIEVFTQNSSSLGNRCELVTYDEAGHGFFNRGDDYTDTVQKMDEFLVSLQYIPPKE